MSDKNHWVVAWTENFGCAPYKVKGFGSQDEAVSKIKEIKSQKFEDDDIKLFFGFGEEGMANEALISYVNI